MRPYRPSGRISFGGLIALLLVTVIGSLVIGGIVFAVSHLIYLVVLFPLIIAFIAGGLLTLVVKSSKIRSPIIAALFGLLLGVGITGVNRFAEYYIDFRNEITNAINEEAGETIPQDEIDAFIDETLEDETGSPGFIGYIKYSASLGTTITRTTSSGSDMTLDETATWIYWGAELLVIMLVAAGMGFKAAREPFNEEAGEWYPAGQYLGSVDWKSRKEFYRALRDGDAPTTFRMITNQPYPAPRVDVFVQSTPSAPGTDVILDVKEIRLNRKRELPANKMKRVVSSMDFNSLTRMSGASLSSVSPGVQTPRVTENME